ACPVPLRSRLPVPSSALPRRQPLLLWLSPASLFIPRRKSGCCRLPRANTHRRSSALNPSFASDPAFKALVCAPTRPCVFRFRLLHLRLRPEKRHESREDFIDL